MLCVGSDFNWKQAALRATAHDECLLATCMWNGHRVMIMTPWKERILMFDETERALFDTSLRPGVRRSEVVEYSVIDFVYSKRLRLRGLQRTCRSRNSDHPCVNCVFFRGRRKCLNPIYEYFLRPIGNVDPQSIDECLAHLLGHKPNCTRGRGGAGTAGAGTGKWGRRLSCGFGKIRAKARACGTAARCSK